MVRRLIFIGLSILLANATLVSAGLLNDVYYHLNPTIWPDFQITKKTQNQADFLHYQPDTSLNCVEYQCQESDFYCQLHCQGSIPRDQKMLHSGGLVNDNNIPVSILQQQDRTILAQVNQNRLLVMNIAHEGVHQIPDTHPGLSLLYKTAQGSTRITSPENIGLADEEISEPLDNSYLIRFVYTDSKGIALVIFSRQEEKMFIRLDWYLYFEMLIEKYQRFVRLRRIAKHYGFYPSSDAGSQRGGKRKKPAPEKAMPLEKAPKETETKKQRETYIPDIPEAKDSDSPKRTRQTSRKGKASKESEELLDKQLDKRRGRKPMVRASRLGIPKWLVELPDDYILRDTNIIAQKEADSKEASGDKKKELELELLWLKVAISLHKQGKWHDFVIPVTNSPLTENCEDWPTILSDDIWQKLKTLIAELSKAKLKAPRSNSEPDDTLRNELLGVWIDESLRLQSINTDWRKLRFNSKRKRKKNEDDTETGGPSEKKPELSKEESLIVDTTLTQSGYQIELPADLLPPPEESTNVDIDGLVVTVRCDDCSRIHGIEHYVAEEKVMKDAAVQTDLAGEDLTTISALTHLLNAEGTHGDSNPYLMENLQEYIKQLNEKKKDK